jgi:dihydroorotase-like cyclic amidohydrolase
VRNAHVDYGFHMAGVIAAGADADIVVFDPARRHVFSTDTSFMNVDYVSDASHV